MFHIRKAIVPAAGLGKRLLPATLAVPKELLPIGREPMLLRTLREVRDAEIEQVAVIVAGGDRFIEEFLFDPPSVKVAGEREVEEAREILSALKIAILRQPEPKGLGDALGLAREFAGDDPFAVALPDNVFFGSTGPLSQLVPVFERHGGHVTGLIRITREEASTFGNCGSVQVEAIGNGEYRVTALGDKGAGFSAVKGSRKAFRWYARHIFLPSFFDYLERFGVEVHGEVDDVPVLKGLVAEEGIVGKLLVGKGFDAGNERGFLATQRYLWGEVSRSWK